MASKPFNFEKALNELNQVVERMEHGEQSLEQSLKDFEQGIALTRQCQQALAEAEQTVKILLEKSAAAEPQPFEPEDDEN